MRNWWGTGLAVALTCALAPAGAAASGSAQIGPLGTTAPFEQCPAVGADPSCGYLIVITDNGSGVIGDPNVGYYDGKDDLLVGVQNSSSGPVSSLHIGVSGSGYGSFKFDGDGLCGGTVTPAPAACPFGPAKDPGDYAGPDTQLAPDPSSTDSGTLTFPNPLQPGQYTYFALASPSGGPVVLGSQNDVIVSQLSDAAGRTSSSNARPGAHLSESSPTDVTDTVQLAGPNAASANGSATFAVFSDASCTQEVGKPDTEQFSKGKATSKPFGSGFQSNATYYIQVNYSAGSSDTNSSASTNCGDVTLTLGTPPSLPVPAVGTELLAPDGISGGHIAVGAGTPIEDTATVTYQGQSQAGRVSYYVFSEPTCTKQVRGVDLGAGITSNGSYPPSATVALPIGTYYFEAIFSGNGTVGSGRSPCGSEVLTVAPPCHCLSIRGFLRGFHLYARGTRLRFSLHASTACSSGPGGCVGTLTLVAPRGAHLAHGKRSATFIYTCSGLCGRRTLDKSVSLEWMGLRLVRHRTRRTLTVLMVERCAAGTRRVRLVLNFDRRGRFRGITYSR
jgi:hypothetical protein